jgi:hypothetical protein
MNEERLNETLSPKPLLTRRNIFSTKPITDNRHQQIALSSEDQNKKSSLSTVTIERQSLSSSPASSASSSSRSRSPPQPIQSSTSDTSVIDTNWIEQQRLHDTNTYTVLPSTHYDRSITRQVNLFICQNIKF